MVAAMMRAVLTVVLLLAATPAWGTCPLLQIERCQEAKPIPPRHRRAVIPVKRKASVPSLAMLAKTQSEHARKIAIHDAQFKAMAASIAALQRQVAELKASK